MAAQRLVMWNQSDWKPGKRNGVAVIDLEPTALVQQHKELAQAIGRGRIISHHVVHHQHGLLVTFIVDG